ncbi:MAG: winged helix-turn-helix domain-containing protein [Kangiellaceae bacterium]|nr:winged helix-turn-helix domain-containing protein [Kangiellaceae bacterium]
MEHSQQYQLGPWIICPQSNTITNNAISNKAHSNKSGTHSLDNKSMQVLLFLIQHAGEQVTKDQIFEQVWKNSIVADDILSVTVSKIRKALGDNARSPTFIKTLPGIGYSLIASVEKLDSDKLASIKQVSNKSDSNKQESTKGIKAPGIYLGIMALLFVASLALYLILSDEGSSTSQLNINSIAVLPFDDLSAEQDNQHFTDGLPDAIINQLSQTNSLKVISRYSSFTYRGKYNASEIGQALQVEALLDGSVQKMGEQVRINVRIFSTKNGQQLWSKTFDSDTQNSFKLQDNISAAIQEIIQPNYVPRDGNLSLTTTKAISAQAYEWYLMGQYHWRQRNPKSLLKAETYFKHSLELAPDYADAHVGLAITYANLHHFANWSERKAIDKALPHIERALALEPGSPTALATKGMILTLKANYETGFSVVDSTLIQQAQQAFLLSLELDNNATTHHWYSSLLKRLGNESQVIQHMNQAVELNPLSASLKRSFSNYLRSIGKPDSAQRMYQRALILEPDHFSHVIDSTHIFRHTQQSIIALAEWQSTNAELFINCSSDEYCEQVALAYLNIGANQAANNVLARMGPKHGHFLDSLDLIEFGLKAEEQKVLLFKERVALNRPNNRRVLFDLGVAQFRAGKFRQAKITLLKFDPEWREPASIKLSDITADNYIALVLHAVTLSNLDQKTDAEFLLKNIQIFLKQDQVFDKIQAQFVLAEINAQLDDESQALVHLATALKMGWLESNHLEWWSLENNHLLQPLIGNSEFKLLLEQHKKKLNQLRQRVTRKLSTISNSIK